MKRIEIITLFIDILPGEWSINKVKLTITFKFITEKMPQGLA